MATKPHTIDTFMAQLLAPIAQSEEQANCRKFMRQLETDRRLAWEAQQKEVDRVVRRRDASWANYRACEDQVRAKALLAAHHAVDGEWLRAMMALFLTPAPSHREMRWKRSVPYYMNQPGGKEAYARDEALLGPIPIRKPKPKKSV